MGKDKEEVLGNEPMPVVEKQPKTKVKLNPEYAASMQLAHEIKVINFLAGGKF